MRSPNRLRNRNGATIAIVAVSLGAMLAMGALTIDLGSLYRMRADAQRVADAAALAGASAFLVSDPGTAAATAADRAFDYAGRNYLGRTLVDVSGRGDVPPEAGWTAKWEAKEATVRISSGDARVKVGVRRHVTSSFFSRIFDSQIFDSDSAFVSASATANAEDAAGSNCVTPFAIPDYWADAADDLDGNKVENGAEAWSYDPAGDTYTPFDPQTALGGQTGYGSAWRDGNGDGVTGDFGRQIVLRPQDAAGLRGPGSYNLWDFDNPAPGSPSLAERITECDPRNVALGDPNAYEVAPFPTGSAIGDAVQARISGSPATWNPTTDWSGNDQVIKVAVYHPEQIGVPEREFNNIALIFLEGVSDDPVTGLPILTGRFLYYASGAPGGGATGALVKTVRLVE